MSNQRDTDLKVWLLEWAIDLDAVADAAEKSKDSRAAHIVELVREAEDACNDLRGAL